MKWLAAALLIAAALIPSGQHRGAAPLGDAAKQLVRAIEQRNRQAAALVRHRTVHIKECSCD
jgi:hypothetical protein